MSDFAKDKFLKDIQEVCKKNNIDLAEEKKKVEQYDTKEHRKSFWFGAICGAIVVAGILMILG